MTGYVLVLPLQKNHVSTEEGKNLTEKIVIVEEKTDGIGNLENLPRLVSIEKNE